MEYYTEEELNFKNLKNSLLLSFAILAVTIFVDLAAILQTYYEGNKTEVIDFMKIITVDFEVALITFVVSNFIYEALLHKNTLTYFIWLFTVLGFTSLVLLKVFNNTLWLATTLSCLIVTTGCLSGYYFKIKNIIKQNGRRMPC